ncbi:MAG TPA: DNA polymerase III subunit epsilon [Methylophilaceae bacterium]
MSRQIFLDTETTGLDPAQGHRIIELAAVEVVNRRLTGNRFHTYLNPEREIDIGAQQVHGISLESLQDKPYFADMAAEFLDFIRDAGLVIHNAPFDLGFLNNELGLIEMGRVESVSAGVIDTLKMAKELHPGQRNNLDALCKRYGIDNSSRTLHGALLDAELLADVYMAMTRGQESLMMEVGTPAEIAQTATFNRQLTLIVLNASEEENAAHEAYVKGLSNALWG